MEAGGKTERMGTGKDMKASLFALILAAVALGGCASRRITTTLELARNNRASLLLDGGSPRVTVHNRGPGTVLVRFEPASDSTKATRIPRGDRVARDNVTPGTVVIESSAEGRAVVTCIIEGPPSLTIQAAKPK